MQPDLYITKEQMIKVKLTESAWHYYCNFNGFANGNKDNEGYSIFSLEYFISLFGSFDLNKIIEDDKLFLLQRDFINTDIIIRKE